MTRRKLLVFSLLAVALSLVLTLVVVLGVDLYLHRRAEQSAGLNRWGYRGPIVGRKQPVEKRVVMLGGSTVFGYGGPWHEAVPALLERFLNERTAPGAIRVINLGFNNEGAFAFLPTLQDFRYLDYDIVRSRSVGPQPVVRRDAPGPRRQPGDRESAGGACGEGALVEPVRTVAASREHR